MNIQEIYQKFKGCGSQICTDTRKLIEGSLFIAIKGEKFDGNEYAEHAISNGCKLALVSDVNLINKEGCIWVEDTLSTLQKLAHHHRSQFNIPVIGITGSNGKTTTKELMNAVLETQYNVLYTEGNLNNHLGVPFTLLRLNENHEIAIIEMGANQPNDISELCEITEPNFGIITNIGKAHIEGFGSYEKLLETKLELYDSVEASGGLVFINLNQKELITNAPSCDLISYGKSGQVNGEVISANPFLQISWKGDKEHKIKTNLVGTYNLANALTAITVGTYFDVTDENIVLGLSSYKPENKRSQFIETDNNKIILDCYNANPTSMMNALENIESLDSENKVLILGDMKELGHISDEEHKNISKRALGISTKSYFVGEEFMKLNLINSFENVSELVVHLRSKKILNSLILIKGSRGVALEKLYDAEVL